jgi:hypothetical protein
MGAYAPLVQHQSATLIDRINLYLGAKTIDKLRLIQGPLTRTPKKPQYARPKPLSAQEELALQQSLSDVENETLKKSLLQLGRSILKRENMKGQTQYSSKQKCHIYSAIERFKKAQT